MYVIELWLGNKLHYQIIINKGTLKNLFYKNQSQILVEKGGREDRQHLTYWTYSWDQKFFQGKLQAISGMTHS